MAQSPVSMMGCREIPPAKADDVTASVNIFALAILKTYLTQEENILPQWHMLPIISNEYREYQYPSNIFLNTAISKIKM